MMRKLFCAMLLVFGPLVGGGFADPASRARNLVDQSWQNYRRANCEVEDTEIMISYDDGRKETKRLTRWIRYDAAGEDRVTIVFSQPPNESGLGLLTWRHPQGIDDQWLKLPSMKQVRRVSASDQSKYFAGTDIAYEDTRQLIGERLTDFSYSIVREADGVVTIEAVPKAGANTAYGKRVMCLDKEQRITRIEYYMPDRTQLIKTQYSDRLLTDEKGRWRVDALHIENALLKRVTRLNILKRQIDSAISPNVFSKMFLESSSR